MDKHGQESDERDFRKRAPALEYVVLLTWADPNPSGDRDEIGTPLAGGREKLPRVWPETYDILSCSGKGHHNPRRPPPPLISLPRTPSLLVQHAHHGLLRSPQRQAPGTRSAPRVTVKVLTARHAGQLTFYGAYHDHPVNVAIHMIFVPVLLWSDFLRVLPAMFLTCECLGLVSFSELVFLLPPSSLTCTP